MKNKILIRIFLCIGLAGLFGGALTGRTVRQNEQNQKKIKMGYAMSNLRSEYFQKTKEVLEQKAEELGVDLTILSANNNHLIQMAQAQSLIDSGVDVLMVTPYNAELSAEIVEYAHQKGVPVLAYDRLILNSDLDAYVSANHEKAGQLQAEYLTKIIPKGNYVYIGGPSTDYNSELLRKGALEVLQPFIDRGDIKLVLDEKMTDWQAILAQVYMAQSLKANNNDISAVIAANDSLAEGAIAALSQEQLEGKVPVVGMDANIAALQRIVEGTQAMTVYKPVGQVVDAALDAAVTLAKKEKLNANAAVNNGQKEVPSILIDPIAVDKNNIDIVIREGYQSYEEVYKNIPEEERPKR